MSNLDTLVWVPLAVALILMALASFSPMPLDCRCNFIALIFFPARTASAISRGT
jgi:hypothetical protein